MNINRAGLRFFTLTLASALAFARPLLGANAWVPDGSSLNVNRGQDAFFPRLAVSAGIPYVAWYESNGKNPQVCVKHWTGKGWVRDGSGADSASRQEAISPTLASCHGTPYLAWCEPKDAVWQVYLSHWTGRAWIQDGSPSLGHPLEEAIRPGLTAILGTPYVAFHALRGDAYQLSVKHLAGRAWVPDGGTLNVNANHWAVDADISGVRGTPYVAWAEAGADEIQRIYVKHWEGSAWVRDGNGLNINLSESAHFPKLADVKGRPYVVWQERFGNGFQIFTKDWDGRAWNREGESLNVHPGESANNPSLCVVAGTPTVAWYEADGKNSQIYVKHWNGKTWEQDGGSLNLNPGQSAYNPSLAMRDGIPYVAWVESDGVRTQLYVKHLTRGRPSPDGKK